MCCLTPFRSGGAGVPSPDASAPTRVCVQGREAVLVRAGAGIKLARWRAPLVRHDSDIGRAEKRKSVLASVSRPDRDGLTAPTPRSPSTSAEGAWRTIRLW